VVAYFLRPYSGKDALEIWIEEFLGYLILMSWQENYVPNKAVNRMRKTTNQYELSVQHFY
jgi:hypothetical protein